MDDGIKKTDPQQSAAGDCKIYKIGQRKSRIYVLRKKEINTSECLKVL
jgi:hypothetical protein